MDSTSSSKCYSGPDPEMGEVEDDKYLVGQQCVTQSRSRKKRHATLTLQDRIAIIQYAETHSRAETIAKFGIAPSTFCRTVSNKKTWLQLFDSREPREATQVVTAPTISAFRPVSRPSQACETTADASAKAPGQQPANLKEPEPTRLAQCNPVPIVTGGFTTTKLVLPVPVPVRTDQIETVSCNTLPVIPPSFSQVFNSEILHQLFLHSSEVNDAIYRWLEQAKLSNAPITMPMLESVARQIAFQLRAGNMAVSPWDRYQNSSGVMSLSHSVPTSSSASSRQHSATNYYSTDVQGLQIKSSDDDVSVAECSSEKPSSDVVKKEILEETANLQPNSNSNSNAVPDSEMLSTISEDNPTDEKDDCLSTSVRSDAAKQALTQDVGSSSGPRKMKALSIEKRVQLIQYMQDGHNAFDAAERFQVGVSTAYRIWTDRHQWLTVASELSDKQRQYRVKTPKRRWNNSVISKDLEAKLNDAVCEWFHKAKNTGEPISRKMLKIVALDAAIQLGIKNFNAPDGWVRRLQKSRNIALKPPKVDACEQQQASTICGPHIQIQPASSSGS